MRSNNIGYHNWINQVIARCLLPTTQSLFTSSLNAQIMSFLMAHLLGTLSKRPFYTARHLATAATTTSKASPTRKIYMPPSSLEIHPLHIYVKSTRNNTIMSLVGPNPKNGLIGCLHTASGGKVGFKKVQRSGYEAGYQCAIRIFQHIRKIHDGLKAKELTSELHLYLNFNGFGQGREGVVRAMSAAEGEDIRNMVQRVTDRTPVKIGGTRPKKRRVL